MTLEEKASLCVGGSYWHTKAIPRLKIPNFMMIDGPSGINKLEIYMDYTCESIENESAILFPCASCTCCSFDRDIMFEMGQTIADEMIKEGISLLLAPGVNIKRSPLCGRNFEYFSEDPLLSSTISCHLIKGIQSKGVGACIKHFAANNQETARFFSNSIIDERTLREIYLCSFELAIKEAKPWAVMSSYNLVNEVYSSANKFLLTDILRNEWNWNEGIVISDWGGTYDRVEGMKAGLDLEMPGPDSEESEVQSIDYIVDSVNKGELDEKLVDRNCERVLNVVFKANELIEKSKSDKSIQFNVKMENVDGLFDLHHEIAKKVAENSFVLLKNEDSILPLPTVSKPSKPFKILFVGEFAENPHVQGAGSARVEPYMTSNCLNSSNEILEQKSDNQKNGVSIEYIKCFGTTDGSFYGDAEKDTIESAKKSDVVVVFAGTEELREIENRDLKNLKLPTDENRIITEIAKVNKNVVVVLQNGGPLEMPWINDVKAILETFLSGEGGGEATANILFGLTNPSGHLAETFPVRLKDNPTFGNFGKKETNYSEGVFVGYRFYEKNNIDVLFPFGHGLSYTQFEYSNLRIDKNNGKSDNPEISVLVDVKNVGKMIGKTVAQIYVSDLVGAVQRPIKELKGFEKIELRPGENKTIIFNLNKRSFAWWNVDVHDWSVSKGKYQIIVGQSSKDPNALTLDINL